MTELATIVESLGAELNENRPAQLLTEADLVWWLGERIADLLQHRTEYLFNLFYCFDVDEAKMHAALLPTALDAPNIGLAKLLIERQKQRIFTKNFYKQPKLSDEDSGF